MISSLDADGDGVLDVDEFMANLDGDGDGMLSEEELKVRGVKGPWRGQPSVFSLNHFTKLTDFPFSPPVPPVLLSITPQPLLNQLTEQMEFNNTLLEEMSQLEEVRACDSHGRLY